MNVLEGFFLRLAERPCPLERRAGVKRGRPILKLVGFYDYFENVARSFSRCPPDAMVPLGRKASNPLRRGNRRESERVPASAHDVRTSGRRGERGGEFAEAAVARWMRVGGINEFRTQRGLSGPWRDSVDDYRGHRRLDKFLGSRGSPSLGSNPKLALHPGTASSPAPLPIQPVVSGISRRNPRLIPELPVAWPPGGTKWHRVEMAVASG
jgi:hypothetical protein